MQTITVPPGSRRRFRKLQVISQGELAGCMLVPLVCAYGEDCMPYACGLYSSLLTHPFYCAESVPAGGQPQPLQVALPTHLESTVTGEGGQCVCMH